MRLALLSLVSVLALVFEAHADWQFTRWGDSVEQILAARADGMRRTTPSEASGRAIAQLGEALATSSYRASGLVSVATYYFKSNRLTGVTLKFRSRDDAFLALSILKAQYGASQAGSTDQMKGDCRDIDHTWPDRERGNVVNFLGRYCVNDPGFGQLLYQPIPAAKDTGF